jgi:hypothetical protein
VLKTITQNPYLNLITGVMLLVTAGYEAWLTVEEAALGAHHGLILFSFLHILKYLPDCMHGF